MWRSHKVREGGGGKEAVEGGGGRGSGPEGSQVVGGYGAKGVGRGKACESVAKGADELV